MVKSAPEREEIPTNKFFGAPLIVMVFTTGLMPTLAENALKNIKVSIANALRGKNF